jgi:predicted lipoprotein
MLDFLTISGIGRATTDENLWVENGAQFEFGNALRAADIVTLPVAAALADSRQKKALDYLIILTGSLQTILGENLAAALGLSVGFSALDGD